MKIGPLDPAHRHAAAALYWQASGPQLSRVLGPAPRAIALIAAALDPRFALGATAGDRLLGLAGYRGAGGAFLTLSRLDLGHFGLGRHWRRLVLASVPRDTETALVIDTLAVVPDQQGEGIGTALLHATGAVAQAAGHHALRIDVAPDNRRAQKLYARRGFTAETPQGMGPFWPLLRARHRIPMRRDLTRPS